MMRWLLLLLLSVVDLVVSFLVLLLLRVHFLRLLFGQFPLPRHVLVFCEAKQGRWWWW